ncbi:PREDICTED: heme-binding protein 2-like [Camelina sativa]|uniref:Heme-binding protein 2-like n=1 Tax=Camelina sativa TaxID=90675 RepID=A0ABM0VVF5_CAMSA|nr:PREDICTED: heme-binding protein 2-like [Camelina sativa]
METGFNILKLSFCLSIVVVGSSAAQVPAPWTPSNGMRPGTCDHYECPTSKLVEAGYAYEIRLYNTAVWISTGPISATSMTQATKTGFQRLFSYIQGKNKDKVKMNMTAPVITQQATPGQSVYTVSFYIPKKNQQNPPQADDLHVQPWKPTYVAVRQFGGYVSDDAAKKEAAALMDSLKGTQWILPIEKSKGKSPAYLVADYNPIFQTTARVNEILVPFTI